MRRNPKKTNINWLLLVKMVEAAESVAADPPIPDNIRELVLKRDGKCMVCGRTKDLHVHHINPGYSSIPANLVTLCKFCHQVVHCLLYVAGKHRFVNVISGFKEKK